MKVGNNAGPPASNSLSWELAPVPVSYILISRISPFIYDILGGGNVELYHQRNRTNLLKPVCLSCKNMNLRGSRWWKSKYDLWWCVEKMFFLQVYQRHNILLYKNKTPRKTLSWQANIIYFFSKIQISFPSIFRPLTVTGTAELRLSEALRQVPRDFIPFPHFNIFTWHTSVAYLFEN